ncbi:antilisterial bacteriocin subtilosin biosynthesis protein AlbA [Methanobrevibacter oralis]|uniref:Antilisterial bacteriocin subtilosin biosynthesis protein AlbA n=1 Tax=Methanobrevibacter oralis TaxID=66851 RepID=A0A162FB66_METOA|nr:radical SAM protein [Methanobrevibacter oralis]KZX10505.1 antilisterial bacteriocin subtilosin biosynthesis protein AlbA [Methanobrevibacter oralis]
MEFTPFLLVFHITGRCNLNCGYCYASKYSKYDDLSLEIIKNILNQAVDLGTKNVIFSGGEPLLHSEIYKILEYSHNLSLTNHITSNGTTITENTIKKLKKYNVDVTISVDGSCKKINDSIRGKGTFDKSIKAIQNLKKNGIYTSLRMTLMKNNYYDVKNYLDLALNNNVDRCIIERVTPINKNENYNQLTFKDIINVFKLMKSYSDETGLNVGSNDPLWLIFSENLEAYLNKTHICGGCTAGTSALCINQDLSVFPCPRLQINSGNLNRLTLKEIWEKSIIFKNLRNRNLIENCIDCKYKYLCGGCRGAAHSNGYYLGNDPQCWMFKDEMCNESY